MKVFIMALLAVLLFSSVVMAQTAVAPAQPIPSAVVWGIALGLDNAFLFEPKATSSKSFLAVGAGIDIAEYTKPLGTSGSKLALYLHGTALTKDNGGNRTPVLGASVNLDVIQLVTGTKLNLLIKDVSCLVGPIVAYDITSAHMAYGGILNINYKF